MQQRPVCKTARTPRHRDADNVKTLGKWFNVLQQKWNCTVTVSLIYIKITADKCIYTNPPFHSDSLAPTHPLPSPCPSGSPRRGDHIKGTFKETALLTVPTIPGPREGPANPNKYNCCVSGFPGPALRIIG